MKPTVVTLVYGLGFGMLLVLIVVPSLIAIQQDVMRYRVSLKRALVTQLWGSYGVHRGGWCDRFVVCGDDGRLHCDR